jgi:hypothetical protein
MVFAFATDQWNTTAIRMIRAERQLLNIENLASMSVTIERGFFVGVLIGCVKESSKNSSNIHWVISRWINLPPIPADSHHIFE